MIMKSNSKASFEVISYDIFSTSNKASSWTMGDFNLDGIEELVTASPEKGRFSILNRREWIFRNCKIFTLS